ncbi:Sec-independent protein translocase subunit TatA [Bailinhaonella thermotolerans]|uniref:Sec-independent protein translocase protein TatA n=1 Tax=Bailinhaonella thermotolerans TaxID=1070861 RepID=A0A3A4B467_9ACTN|nr:Sec-independent protein translocase subunit TatA [Bailinhaonella thermotolerans]RJL35961.1 twin-arginine translocase TatA/TatE family subunit [Bailinhaonella thermotolerans]
MPFNLGAPELIIIGLIIVLLFGAKKLPDTARALGRSLRIFKAETKSMTSDDDQPTAQPAAPQAQAAPAAPQQLPAAAPQPAAPQQPADAVVNGVPVSDAQRDQQRR